MFAHLKAGHSAPLRLRVAHGLDCRLRARSSKLPLADDTQSYRSYMVVVGELFKNDALSGDPEHSPTRARSIQSASPAKLGTGYKKLVRGLDSRSPYPDFHSEVLQTPEKTLG